VSGVKTLSLMVIILMIVTAVFAEDKKWGNETELSYVDTSGNTEVTTLSAKNLLTYKFSDKLNSAWEAGAFYAENDNVKNSERYYTKLRLNYLFTEKFYTSLIAGWEKDKFVGIDAKYYIGPALGYKILIGLKHFFLAEAGADYVKEEYTDDTDDHFARGRVFTKYEYAFTAENKFSQSVEYLSNFDDYEDYNVISETSLISSLSDSFSLKTTYEIKYKNVPVPETLEYKDTTLKVTLVINF
jgi:putative salt-induced outer membrane protein